MTTDCHCGGGGAVFAWDGDGKENIHFLPVLMMDEMVMEVLLIILVEVKG